MEQDSKNNRLNIAAEEWFSTSDNQEGLINTFWTVRNLAMKHYVCRTTLKNRIDAKMADKTVNPVGRPKIFSDSVKNTFKLIAQNRDISKNSFTSKTIKPELKRLRTEEILNNGGNSYSLTEYSSSSYWRFLKENLPERVITKTNQNQRRYEALVDLRNFSN
jgi:hypothetical protein